MKKADEPQPAGSASVADGTTLPGALTHVFELDNFRGPLDLLLHLIREEELEITAVSLARICDQYQTALSVMRKLDINVAGEFLVIASTLLLIKSRTLLPREDVDLAEELDPADELILQLIEYRKYKTLALALGRAADDRAQRFERGTHDVPADAERELAEISLWDLVGSFARLVEELGLQRRFHTLESEKPLREYLRAVLDNLVARETWTFRELVESSGGAAELFGIFLAMLELVRTRQVAVEQKGVATAIVVRLRQDRDASQLAAFFGEALAAPALDESQGTAILSPPEH